MIEFPFFSICSSNFACFLRIFDEFFSGFRAKFQKRVTCVAFSIKFAKTNQKFAENSEICENYSILVIRVLSQHSAGRDRGGEVLPAEQLRAEELLVQLERLVEGRVRELLQRRGLPLRGLG